MSYAGALGAAAGAASCAWTRTRNERSTLRGRRAHRGCPRGARWCAAHRALPRLHRRERGVGRDERAGSDRRRGRRQHAVERVEPLPLREQRQATLELLTGHGEKRREQLGVVAGQRDGRGRRRARTSAREDARTPGGPRRSWLQRAGDRRSPRSGRDTNRADDPARPRARCARSAARGALQQDPRERSAERAELVALAGGAPALLGGVDLAGEEGQRRLRHRCKVVGHKPEEAHRARGRGGSRNHQRARPDRCGLRGAQQPALPVLVQRARRGLRGLLTAHVRAPNPRQRYSASSASASFTVEAAARRSTCK